MVNLYSSEHIEQSFEFENIVNRILPDNQRSSSLLHHVKNIATKEKEFKEKLDSAKKQKDPKLVTSQLYEIIISGFIFFLD